MLVPNGIFISVIVPAISGSVLKSEEYAEVLFVEVREAMEVYNQDQAC